MSLNIEQDTLAAIDELLKSVFRMSTTMPIPADVANAHQRVVTHLQRDMDGSPDEEFLGLSSAPPQPDERVSLDFVDTPTLIDRLLRRFDTAVFAGYRDLKEKTRGRVIRIRAFDPVVVLGLSELVENNMKQVASALDARSRDGGT